MRLVPLRSDARMMILARHIDVEVERSDAAFAHRLGAERPALDRQAAQFALERVDPQACVHERAHDHVAARAAEAVETGDPHGRRSAARAALRLMRDAAHAAPKPLSMLTTATPPAHALSMVKSAARPPNEAPYPTLVGTAITGLSVRPAMRP